MTSISKTGHFPLQRRGALGFPSSQHLWNCCPERYTNKLLNILIVIFCLNQWYNLMKKWIDAQFLRQNQFLLETTTEHILSCDDRAQICWSHLTFWVDPMHPQISCWSFRIFYKAWNTSTNKVRWPVCLMLQTEALRHTNRLFWSHYQG